MSITQKALAEQDYIISLRRDFHAHPEISLKEYRTAQRIEEELDKLGIPHQRSGETGVYAEIKGERPGTGIIACGPTSTRWPSPRPTKCPINPRHPA